VLQVTSATVYERTGMLIALVASLLASTPTTAQSQSDDSAASEPAIAVTDYPFSRPIRDLVAGDWSAGSCSGVFQRFTFSEDGTQMFAVPSVGFLADTPESQPREVAIYNVLDESGRILRMQIEDESRRTDDGRVVVWDLVLLSEDSFCWHRTDWRPGGCTRPLTRCPA